jgi:hypothetical protein
MAVEVKVIRHTNPNGDAETVDGSYAKAVDDAIGGAATGNVKIASAWDPDSSSVVTTILIFS